MVPIMSNAPPRSAISTMIMNIWGDRLELAPITCGDHDSSVRCHQAESADDKLSGNNHDHDPCSQFPGWDQADHGGAYQQLCLPADP